MTFAFSWKALRVFHRSSLIRHSSLFRPNSFIFYTKSINSISFFSTTAFRAQENKGKSDNSSWPPNNNGNPLANASAQLFAALFIFWLLNREISKNDSDEKNSPELSWNEFYSQMLLKGEVEKVVILRKGSLALVYLYEGAIYRGHPLGAHNRIFQMVVPQNEKLEDRIRQTESSLNIRPNDGISIVYDWKTEEFGKVVAVAIGSLITVAIIFALRKSLSVSNPFKKIGRADFTLILPHSSSKGVHFSDVAGLYEAKMEVIEFVDYLKNPKKYSELGAKPPKGAILFGPPGCGKTLLAKAVANESAVPFLSMNGSEFIEMIGGIGAARVRDLFAEARKRAPSIIYIDEIDAIGRKRSSQGGPSSGGGESEQTLNQLLVEMDGIASRSGIIMFASTNRPDVLDSALLRPGRFDRHITIDLPTLIERREILEQHMKGVVFEKDPSVYSNRLATLTPGFSGADLANLINEAALHAARLQYSQVKLENLEYAIERVIAGPEKRNSSLGVAERKIVAYHEAGHAIVGWLLRHTDALLKVTIIPRTSMALGFAQYTPVDKKLFSEDELLDRMCMALGGRVAESLTFNKITTGAQNDLVKVTNMAYSQIKNYGFNDSVGLISFEKENSGKRMYGKKLQATMDFEAQKLIASAYKITEKVLKEHFHLLELLAEELLVKETLNYDDVEKLIGPPKWGKKHLISPSDFEVSLEQLGKSK